MKKTLLEEAEEIFSKSRESDYGSAYKNHKHIKEIYNSITGQDISEEDVVMMMYSVKLSREQNKHKRDNLVDVIGYTFVLDKINEEKNNN